MTDGGIQWNCAAAFTSGSAMTRPTRISSRVSQRLYDRDWVPLDMAPTNANPWDAGKFSATRKMSELQQSADIDDGVGHQRSDNYRIGKDRVASFEQICRDARHE